jgi:hypothetical protein
MGGPPGETPKDFNGTIRWYVEEKRHGASRMAAGKAQFFRIEASVGRIVITNSKKVYNCPSFVIFIVQLGPPASHLAAC